jgi:hypothetical protein
MKQTHDDPFEQCRLCGSGDNNMISDHLRTICVRQKRPFLLDQGYFRPVLNEDEKSRLGTGEQKVCSNRQKCRSRQP